MYDCTRAHQYKCSLLPNVYDQLRWFSDIRALPLELEWSLSKILSGPLDNKNILPLHSAHKRTLLTCCHPFVLINVVNDVAALSQR